MTDHQLLQAEHAARISAHNAPIYTGDVVLQAVRSSVRAGRVADEWLRLRAEVSKRDLSALERKGAA